MEGISADVYRGLKSYWKRRGYERLDGQKQRTRTQSQTEPGQLGRARRRFWRVRKIRVLGRFGSPKRWITRLRDAYVKMMLSFANSSSGPVVGPVEYGYGFRKGPLKEYDEKMIVEIYKSVLMAQGQILSARQTPPKIRCQVEQIVEHEMAHEMRQVISTA